MSAVTAPRVRCNGGVALRVVIALVAFLVCAIGRAAGTLTIGVVTDGPVQRELLPIARLQAEANSVLAGDPQIQMPDALMRDGGWTLAGINAALDALLANPNVDMVVTLGLMSSNQAAKRTHLSKPVIAPYVADPLLEQYPLADGHSGRRNFTYVADFIALKEELQTFGKVVRFKHLAAIVDRLELAGIPGLTEIARQIEAEQGVRVTIVPGGDSVPDMLAALPADADAVFVAPLQRLNGSQVGDLASGLAARKLPTLVTNRAEVEAGFLMASTGSAEDQARLARRIALNIQRIHGGEDAAKLEVALVVQQRLVINMRTARAIGFSPRWKDMTDAEQLFADEALAGTALTLTGAMRRAIESNPSLAASRLEADLAQDDVRSARANLLPQIDVLTTASRIDAEHASPFSQAERSATAELSLKQLIYSESVWAGYAISEHLANASDAAARAALLETLQSTATAYLNLQRAKAVESVRRANAENTRRNLETSRVRESVGLSERSDYLRWVAQLARDRASQLDAEANRRQAETELRRQLHLQEREPIQTVDAGLDDPMTLVTDKRTQSYIETPAKWAIFSEFSVDAARRAAPEIQQLDAQVSAGQRALKSAGRAFYLPDLALVSSRDDQYWRAGVGAEPVPGAPSQQSWRITLQASFPLFTGGARRAELSRARHQYMQVNAQRDSVVDGVDARTRAALQRIASSYPSIDLSRSAAEASGENLRMVSDAYGRGIVSVTELIDAQDANLSADLAAAESKYTFLIDFVDVLRATGSFSMLLDPDAKEDWYRRLDAWFHQHADTKQP